MTDLIDSLSGASVIRADYIMVWFGSVLLMDELGPCLGDDYQLCRPLILTVVCNFVASQSESHTIHCGVTFN